MKLVPQIAGVALYQQLFLAWTGIFTIAILYCLFRSLIDSDYLFVAGDTAKWAVTQWGAWPFLLPMCVYLIKFVEQRISLRVGLVAGMFFAVLGASLFAYISGRAFGADTLLLHVSYYMAPIAAGTYLFFGVVVYWYYHQSVPETPAAEAISTNDNTVILDVWNGRVQTQVEANLIEWTRAARNYVELHANGRSYLMRAGIAVLERRLPNGSFLRTHRSYLVNTKFVVGIAGGSAQPSVVLESGFQLPIGKKYRDTVLAAIRQKVATS